MKKYKLLWKVGGSCAIILMLGIVLFCVSAENILVREFIFSEVNLYTDIEIRTGEISDIFNTSKLMADSCRAVYKGIMNDEYLDSITDNQYVRLLEMGLKEKTINYIVHLSLL